MADLFLNSFSGDLNKCFFYLVVSIKLTGDIYVIPLGISIEGYFIEISNCFLYLNYFFISGVVDRRGPLKTGILINLRISNSLILKFMIFVLLI